VRHGLTDQASLDRVRLLAAIELSCRCEPSEVAYSVGALVFDEDCTEIASGYSREIDAHVHAEEAALGKLARRDLRRATIYSSLEPCSTRKSRPRSCTDLILDAGIRRVVYALREPSIFVDCDGVERLRAAGVIVFALDELGELVRKVNAHLFVRVADS